MDFYEQHVPVTAKVGSDGALTISDYSNCAYTPTMFICSPLEIKDGRTPLPFIDDHGRCTCCKSKPAKSRLGSRAPTWICSGLRTGTME